ncbi:hypothetical protein [uncultured Endozoicomonas sp.]|uniref:hypothetical protein n=1 Tax=uncultured Endozoicomonas sp. TaxID=432652 RepID=UPI002624FD00|nr:hypothetical protein [uncultured Endozoicomonas sp.]
MNASFPCSICKEPLTKAPKPNTSAWYQPKESGTYKSGISTASANKVRPEVTAITLPCKHSFHFECISTELKERGVCPVDNTTPILSAETKIFESTLFFPIKQGDTEQVTMLLSKIKKSQCTTVEPETIIPALLMLAQNFPQQFDPIFEALEKQNLTNDKTYSEVGFAISGIHPDCNIRPDLTKAIKLLEKAADKNNPEAALNLGVIYVNRKDNLQELEKGRALLKRAAECDEKQINALALTNLGASYVLPTDRLMNGSCDKSPDTNPDIPTDYKTALRYLEQSLEASRTPPALIILARIYMHGKNTYLQQGFDGISRDYVKARALSLEAFGKTPENNFAEQKAALRNLISLADRYRDGIGCEIDTYLENKIDQEIKHLYKMIKKNEMQDEVQESCIIT